MAGEGEPVTPLELITFTSRECYVYGIPPAPTSLGHRAELWNVNKWIAEVSTKTITSGDNICVVLEDKTSGAVFAECPVDNDKPLDASVEPVLDSSRYFVLRVVDPASGRHAFLGLGFREREHAISFRAALDDHRQYLRRMKEAAQLARELRRPRPPARPCVRARTGRGSVRGRRSSPSSQGRP